MAFTRAAIVASKAWRTLCPAPTVICRSTVIVFAIDRAIAVVVYTVVTNLRCGSCKRVACIINHPLSLDAGLFAGVA